MNFSSDAIADFEDLTFCQSRNLQAAEGGKGIANAANELCDIAFNRQGLFSVETD